MIITNKHEGTNFLEHNTCQVDSVKFPYNYLDSKDGGGLVGGGEEDWQEVVLGLSRHTLELALRGVDQQRRVRGRE